MEEYAAGKRENTRNGFEQAFRPFEEICNPKKLASVNERMGSAFVAGLRAKPGKQKGQKGFLASTIALRLQYLRTALNWGAEQKMIPTAPKFPKIETLAKHPHPVPEEAFPRQFDKTTDRQLQTNLLCGWLAGMRLREDYFLEWEQTDSALYLDLAARRFFSRPVL